jgi:hypothetical protein
MKAELHTFQEMLEHIQNGGAAHRFGSWYPLYRLRDGQLTRRCSSSMGDVENGFMTSVHFSLEEQQSNDWIIVDGGVLKQRDEDNRRSYQEYLAAQLEREKAKPPKRKSWWRGLFLLDTRVGKG